MGCVNLLLTQLPLAALPDEAAMHAASMHAMSFMPFVRSSNTPNNTGLIEFWGQSMIMYSQAPGRGHIIQHTSGCLDSFVL